MKKILSFWPYLFFFFITCFLFVQNYTPGTYLTGWDNLHPEYNFLLNIKRSIFSVWEEYQGLGLLGGHAHSSDLPHQLSLLFLSLFLPVSLLRYLSTFAMLFLGASGAYALVRRHLFSEHPRVVSVIVGLFYLLNLATIQTFYVPFESFIAHFAALPWLLLVSLNYFLKPSRAHLWQLVIILILSAPASYIPTLFIVYLMALTICLFPFVGKTFLKPHTSEVTKKHTLIRTLKLYTIIFLINAFWLLPFSYFTLTNANVNLESKINQAATQTIFLQNKEYGNVFNLMLLQGFWFKSVDPNFDGIFTYMLAPWQSHLSNPLVSIMGYLFFLVVLIGFVRAVRSRSPSAISFGLLFIFIFIVLAVATPPFSWINTVVRTVLPLFNQAFRFPFTKFSLLAGLVYAVLFGYGISYLITVLTAASGYTKLMVSRGVVLLSMLLLILYMLPLFQGHLFYEKERLTPPQEYRDLFTFFSQQDQNTRIANLPQYTFWGWNFYRWGYGGSGFLWYGIKQPILDRAFDVWSKTDENYYYELSNALNSKNPQLLTEVINKYQINWLLIDKNIIYPPSPKALLLDELEPLIQQVPGTKKAATFGNLIVYKTSLPDKPTSFVFTTPHLPTVNPYSWNHFDQAYTQLGNYQTTTDLPAGRQGQGLTTHDYFYPFRSLFTDKTEKEREFMATDNGPTMTFSQMLPANFSKYPLRIPSLLQNETIMPVTIETVAGNGTVTIYATLQAPQVSLGDTTIGGQVVQQSLFTIRLDPKRKANYILNSNGVATFPIPLTTQRVGTTFLPLSQNTIFVLTDTTNKTSTQVTISPLTMTTLPIFQETTLTPSSTASQLLSVTLPKIDDQYLSATLNPEKFSTIANCDNFRQGKVESTITKGTPFSTLTLTSQNATACVPFFLPTLPHREGYVIFITSSNEKGRSLHFWMENTDVKSGSLDTYLPESREETDTAFILPPLEEFGNAYALHFDNISIGKDVTQNTLKRVSIYPIPYSFLTSLVFANTAPKKTPSEPKLLTVTHPNESSYTIRGVDNTTSSTLVLSQSFDAGWQAFQSGSSLFPFFGKRLEHIQVNNWENGWDLGSGAAGEQQIVIIYLPQYLEFLGFFILVLTLLYVAAITFQKRHS